MTKKPMTHKGGREAYEMSDEALRDDYVRDKGDQLAAASEDYHYAKHPDQQHPMTEAERLKAIATYENLIYSRRASTSESGSPQ